LKIALAIFVKTPGHSLIKTRLASSVGKTLAEDFYLQSVKAIESVALELKQSSMNLEVFWAVAEKDSEQNLLWKNFERIYQGEGDLGQRLSCIHDQLFLKFDIIYFLGADSPHLSIDLLKNAINDFSSNSSSAFQIGDALDGGFYLLGMKEKIPTKIWTAITYSSDSTSMQLKEKIQSIGSIDELKKEFDIDTLEDLLNYKKNDFEILNPTKEQLELIKWVKINF
jgi:glycosyltransferase A (GT-A) superfamily protein (DUF2064 family)